MEQSKALHKLSEASDLLLLLEDMVATGNSDRIAPTSWAGIRLLMKSVRESVQQSHAVLAGNMINRSKEDLAADQQNRAGLATQVETIVSAAQQIQSPIQQNIDLSATPTLTRKDLKSSLERFIDAQ